MSKERPRDESGKFEETVTEQDILKVFDRADEPVLTANDIADALPIGRDAVYRRLRDMHDKGLIGRKETGARAVAWWAKVEPAPDVEGVEEMKAGDFRGIVQSDKTARELIEESREKDREREERLMKVARGEDDGNDE